MSFWESMWSIVVAFFFVAYLILLFQILSDLFRDRELGGFAKAAWIFFLFIAPFITALVYIIARGGGMAARGEARVREEAEATDSYVRRIAGTASPAQQIESARSLLADGSITESEFDRLKSMALSA
ncbi:PLDc N-terminal domain-containing protein [Arthrobacter sp. zg-Y1116]|uniref:PLDc N-terminal domain-containing protein n=1 Tax=Arthrobacter sp. zg-Y1116 TaxID=2964611 RepID=UPI002106D042|nr:PLDc N-terminal domain-containing protein [Arthrobacter sp. zg-Y1116]MCQ1946677.1 PLDc N-terminal domain-containing protein [Arthrobacter sp. zg-Y1116]